VTLQTNSERLPLKKFWERYLSEVQSNASEIISKMTHREYKDGVNKEVGRVPEREDWLISLWPAFQ
jgi:hypothetical protein